MTFLAQVHELYVRWAKVRDGTEHRIYVSKLKKKVISGNVTGEQ
jgi:hypothetical protein